MSHHLSKIRSRPPFQNRALRRRLLGWKPSHDAPAALRSKPPDGTAFRVADDRPATMADDANAAPFSTRALAFARTFRRCRGLALAAAGAHGGPFGRTFPSGGGRPLSGRSGRGPDW